MTQVDSPRTFAIGDVHGCAVALELLLNQLELTRDDRLILLGDIVDRGPDSRLVIDQLLEIRDACRLDLVRGNHEEMLLTAIREPRSLDFWIECGGEATLASYGGHLDGIPNDHLEFLAAASPYIETEHNILIHANLEPDVPLELQTGEWLRWRKLTGAERPHPSGKRIVCGHTEMPGGVPRSENGWAMLDTSAYRGGFLTALDLNTGELFQASQRGEFRGGVNLDEL